MWGRQKQQIRDEGDDNDDKCDHDYFFQKFYGAQFTYYEKGE